MDNTVSAAARLLGINKSGLGELAARGIVKRGQKRGTFELEASVSGYCVRTLFARYHVRYKIVEASDNPSVLAYMTKKFGDTSVPWTVVDGIGLVRSRAINGR